MLEWINDRITETKKVKNKIKYDGKLELDTIVFETRINNK